jgi:hypothetical protein
MAGIFRAAACAVAPQRRIIENHESVGALGGIGRESAIDFRWIARLQNLQLDAQSPCGGLRLGQKNGRGRTSRVHQDGDARELAEDLREQRQTFSAQIRGQEAQSRDVASGP